MGQSDQDSASVTEIQNPAPPDPAVPVFDEKDETRATCDVLCSLGASHFAPDASASAYMDDGTDSSCGEKQGKGKGCPKQHQLPMFLSSKFPTAFW